MSRKPPPSIPLSIGAVPPSSVSAAKSTTTELGENIAGSRATACGKPQQAYMGEGLATTVSWTDWVRPSMAVTRRSQVAPMVADSSYTAMDSHPEMQVSARQGPLVTVTAANSGPSGARLIVAPGNSGRHGPALSASEHAYGPVGGPAVSGPASGQLATSGLASGALASCLAEFCPLPEPHPNSGRQSTIGNAGA